MKTNYINPACHAELSRSVLKNSIILFMVICSHITLAQTTNSGSSCPRFVTYTSSTGSAANPTTNNGSGTATTSTETDAATSGWTKMSISGTTASANAWSSSVTMPFDFYFYGALVSQFQVSYNGILSFGANTAPPTGNNATLPYSTSDALNNSVCFWDYYQLKGSNDYIYYKVKGTTPNRQLWVKWVATDMSSPKFTNNYFAFVLEEISNNVYFVDMLKGTTAKTTNTQTATLGLQYNSSYYTLQSASAALSSASTKYTDNNYYKFSYAIGSTEVDTASFTSATMVTSTAEQLIYPTQYSCLTNSISESKLHLLLNLGDDYTLGSPSATNNFEASLGVTYTLYDENCNSLYTENNTLSLSASTTAMQVEQLLLEDISAFTSTLGAAKTITDVDHIGIKISKALSTSGATTSSSISDNISLTAWLTQEYKEDVNSGDYETASLITLSTPAIDGNKVDFSWTSACELTNHYQIQVMRLYNLDEDNASDPKYVYNNKIDWDKALSIEVEDKTSISLYMAEGSGYYAWRVRPIGDYYEGGIADSRNWGLWSKHAAMADENSYFSTTASRSAFADGITINASSASKNYIFYVEQADENISWIYNRTFTEDNSIAQGMQYANGLGQLKQSQRILNEVDSVLVNQTAYDFVGRPAIQSMTAPVNQQKLGYINTLLQDENGELYDPKDFDSDERTEYFLKANGGDDEDDVPIWENCMPAYGSINDYFSDKNSDINIPNAENFPYSRTIYDKLSRPKKMSLFGAEHRMGLYDETYIDGGMQRTIRTYYSSVNDTILLKAMGNMTPADTSMYQIIRVDPNGVATAEFKTLDGRTIATAMIDAGKNELLDSVYEGNTWYTKIISSQTKMDDYSYVKEDVINFSVPEVDVYIDYSLDIKSFSANCVDYCSACDYLIELYAIREETNELKVSKTVLLNPDDYKKECLGNDATYKMDQYSFLLEDPGNYTIGRKITVNRERSDGERYKDYHAGIINDSLDVEATKFDVLLAYVDSEETDKLNKLYDYIEDLPTASVTSTSTGKKTSLTTNDIWLEATDKDEDGNIESYTIASNCLSIDIPKIDCDWSPCDDLWVLDNTGKGYAEGDTNHDGVVDDNDDATQNYDEVVAERFTENGGYYDFESMLFDKWGDDYGKKLYRYFYDKYGNHIFESGETGIFEFTIKSDQSSGTEDANYNGNRYSYDEYIRESDAPTFSLTIDPDGENGEEPPMSPDFITSIQYAEFQGRTSGAKYKAITVNDYGTNVYNQLLTLLSVYSNDYSIDIDNSETTKSTITITTNFAKQYPTTAHDISIDESSTSGVQVHINADRTESSSSSDFTEGNGAINCMLNHMLYETIKATDGVTDSSVYGDCYDMFSIWESWVNNYPALLSSIGSESKMGPDFLQSLVDAYGAIYSGFSNHEFGETTESTGAISYGNIEYAYKSFEFDTTAANLSLSVRNSNGDIDNQQYNCASQWGIELDKPASKWSNPKDGDASQDPTWDETTCGDNAWWDKTTSSIIADERYEDAQCQAWKNFYGCLQSDFAAADRIVYGDEIFDGTVDEVLLNSIGGAIIEKTEDFLDKRLSGLSYRIQSENTSISKGDADLYAADLISDMKSQLSSLEIQKSADDQYVTGMGNASQKELLKNIWQSNIDFSISDDSPKTYSHIIKQDYTKGELLAKWLNNAFSESDAITVEEINNELDAFTENYNLASGYFDSYKSNGLNVASTTTYTVLSSSVDFEFIYRTSNGRIILTNISGKTSSIVLLNALPSSSTITRAACNYMFSGTTLNTKLSVLTSIQAVKYTQCDPRNTTYIYNQIQDALTTSKQKVLNKSLKNYTKDCTLKKNIDDTLKIRYRLDYHYFTLFYYDMAGNLVKTVPPAGVDTTTGKAADSSQTTDKTKIKYYQATRSDEKNHTLATTYAYNSLGQRIREQTPDGGKTEFWYNSLGQLRISQNAKQKKDGKYSYLKYDELARLTESGESTLDATGQKFAGNKEYEDDDYPASACTYKTIITYSTPATTDLYYIGKFNLLDQNYLQNRVSYSHTDFDGVENSGDETYVYYSYDPHGNVEWMLQSIAGMGINNCIAYEYDLVSNKITRVNYNEGRADQFFHRYTYDSDNRIRTVETSHNGELWDKDATYEYYAHGPLKRMSIGEDKIQGIDYVYTINGWLKGINHQDLSYANDPGHDGNTTSSSYAMDVFGNTLGYFEGDFKRKYGSDASPFNSEFSDATSAYYNSGVKQMDWYRDINRPSYGASTDTSVDYRPLFNGCITNSVYNTNIPDGDFTNSKIENKAQGFKYNYDELYRITQANFDYYAGTSTTPTTTWYKKSLTGTTSTYEAYKSSYGYDYNGNITSLKRYAYTSSTPTPTKLKMDDLTYNYTANTNQLSYVKDAITAANYTVDIDDQTAYKTTGNYTYDELGRLIGDQAEGITAIEWTPSNKVDSVSFGLGKQIAFEYDALGNKSIKKVYTTSADTMPDVTYYINDTKGKTIAIYTDADDADLLLSEQPLYANSKIGEYKSASGISPTASLSSEYKRTLNEKYYEINDYLGNVRAVVTDIKDPNTKGGGYTANVVSASDYYPFGMVMPGRDYQSSSYRYGYNGMERDEDLKGNGNSYDFGARILDPRLGRWLSTDPLDEKFASMSPYCAFANNPIMYVDKDGREAERSAEELYEITKTIVEVAHINVDLLESVEISSEAAAAKAEIAARTLGKPTLATVATTVEDGAVAISSAAHICTILGIAVSTIDAVGLAMQDDWNRGTNIRAAGTGAGLAAGLVGLVGLSPVGVAAISLVGVGVSLFGQHMEEKILEEQARFRTTMSNQRIFMRYAKMYIEAAKMLDKSLQVAYGMKIQEERNKLEDIERMRRDGWGDELCDELKSTHEANIKALEKERDENIQKVWDASEKKIDELKKITETTEK